MPGRGGLSIFSQLCVYYYTDVVPAVVNEIQEDGVTFIEAVTTSDEGKMIHKNSKRQDPVQMS